MTRWHEVLDRLVVAFEKHGGFLPHHEVEWARVRMNVGARRVRQRFEAYLRELERASAFELSPRQAIAVRVCTSYADARAKLTREDEELPRLALVIRALERVPEVFIRPLIDSQLALRLEIVEGLAAAPYGCEACRGEALKVLGQLELAYEDRRAA